MKSLDFQSRSTGSKELGAVIEAATHHKFIAFWKVAVIWLVVGLILAGLSYFEAGWHGAGLMILFTALGFTTNSLLRLSSKTGDQVLRVHENGIGFEHDGVPTEIQYCQLDEYRCKKTVIFNGADHVGSAYEMELTSREQGYPRTIRWTSGGRFNMDDSQQEKTDFDALHFEISRRVADNMSAILKENHRVSWGESTVICKNGIEIKMKTGIFSAENKFIPWPEIRGMEFEDGKLSLSFESGNGSLKIDCSESNLLSGFLLVHRLMKTNQEDRMLSRQTDEKIAFAMAQRWDHHFSVQF